MTDRDPDACPEVSPALLAHLEAVFPPPEPCPGQLDQLPEIMFRSGQNAVVRYLRTWLERQARPPT